MSVVWWWFLLGELWLGLEKLHHFTSQGNYSLNITMTDFDDKTYLAIYDQFQVTMMMIMIILMRLLKVGPGEDYVLTVGWFNAGKSTLGDSMGYHNGMKFTAK